MTFWVCTIKGKKEKEERSDWECLDLQRMAALEGVRREDCWYIRSQGLMDDK